MANTVEIIARLNGVAQVQQGLLGITASLRNVAVQAAQAFAAYKISGVIKESTLLAARVETLGITLKIMGQNAGYSGAQMNGFVESVKKMGITTQEAQSAVIRMTQAHMDLAKANQLARVAQDAAVIGNINSSEAFNRMIHGITTLQPEILRGIGLTINFEQEYAKFAQTSGRVVTSLSYQEKQQIAANAVLEKGKDIAGSYEAAMNTAGKQINSLARYHEELKLKVGSIFNPALAAAVKLYTEILADAGKKMDSLAKSGELKTWANLSEKAVIGLAIGFNFVTIALNKMAQTAFPPFTKWSQEAGERIKENIKDIELLRKMMENVGKTSIFDTMTAPERLKEFEKLRDEVMGVTPKRKTEADPAADAMKASLSKISAELDKVLAKNKAMSSLLGPAFEKQKEDLQAYQSALENLIEAGLDPVSAKAKNLADKVHELETAIAIATVAEKASEEQKEKLRKALEEVSEAFKQANADGKAYQYMLEQQSEAMNKAADPYRTMSDEMDRLQDLYNNHGLSIEAFSAEALVVWEQMTSSMSAQTQNQIAHYEELGKRGVMTQQEVAAATKQALDEYEKATGRKLAKVKDHWDDLKKAIEGWSKDFTNKLYDALGGGKSAFKDFFASIMEQMSKLMLQKFITDPLLGWMGGGLNKLSGGGGGLNIGSILSSSGGLGGGLSYLGSMGSSLLSGGAFGNFFNAGLLGSSGFASAGASLAALFHDGGPVAQYAPRYHSGYASDEVKAVLQTGEGVLSRKGMKALGQLNDGSAPSGGGGGQPINVIIQAMDAQSFSEYTKRNADAILAPVLESMRRSGAMRDMMLFTT